MENTEYTLPESSLAIIHQLYDTHIPEDDIILSYSSGLDLDIFYFTGNETYDEMKKLD